MSDLFNAAEPVKRETSAEAARTIWKPTDRQALIVIALNQFPDGLTDHELSAKTKLAMAIIQPRRSDLTAMGKVVDSGARRLTPYEKMATVWKLVD